MGRGDSLEIRWGWYWVADRGISWGGGGENNWSGPRRGRRGVGSR